MSIITKIKNFKKNNTKKLFTTPSHAQGSFIPPIALNILGKNFYECDYSEIDGFDNLQNPTGPIKKLQDKISKIYESKASFMLLNGSTSGVISAMLATLKENDNVLIARNCHISIYNGLVLTGANPIWVEPEYNKNWNIYESINKIGLKQLIEKQKNVKALIITTPTYEGIFTDIKEIAQICKENKIILIVDEAHGALLNFSELKKHSALTNGADIVIHSLHKTAGAPNPCALIHIGNNSDIKPTQIQNALNLVNTTSPSYPLMCAVEATVNYLATKKGRNAVLKLYKNIQDFKKNLNKNIEIFETDYKDETKILIKLNNKNLKIISEILYKEHNIEEEYHNDKCMLFITGIGTTKTKLKTLAKALNRTIKTSPNNLKKSNEQKKTHQTPITIYSPRIAYFKDKTTIQKEDAIGKVCGEIIIDYPPGIPAILPGEKITKENIKYIKNQYVKVIN